MILEKKTVADNSVVYPDELRIPLTKHIKKLRYKSKVINFTHFILLLSFSVPYYLIYLYLSDNGKSITDWWKLLVFITFIFALVMLFIFGSIKQARVELELYENGVPDFIFLDKNGIKFPVTLLWHSPKICEPLKKTLLDGRIFSLNLSWQDILAWDVEHRYSDMRGWSAPACYYLQVKHGILPGNKEYPYRCFVSIERVLSSKEEKKLLDFAQHFLSVPIKKPNWRLFWILVSVPVFLVILGWVVKNGK